MRPTEAADKVGSTDAEKGHYKISCNHAEDDMALKLRDSRKLKLRAQHEKSKRCCNRGKTVQGLVYRLEVGEPEAYSALNKNRADTERREADGNAL